MFEELAVIPKMAVGFLDTSNTGSPNWRGWYQWYGALESWIRSAESTIALIDRDQEAIGGAYDQRWSDRLNDALGRLGTDHFALIQGVYVLAGRQVGRPLAVDAQSHHASIRSHCHPKSDWMLAWGEFASIGKVTQDGTMLEQRVLRVHPTPSPRLSYAEIEEGRLLVSRCVSIDSGPALAAAVRGA